MFPIQHKTVFLDGELLTISQADLVAKVKRAGGNLVLRPSKGVDYMVQGEGAEHTSDDLAWADGVQYLTEWDLLHSLGLLTDPDWSMAEKLPPLVAPTIYHPDSYVSDAEPFVPMPDCPMAIRYSTCMQQQITPADILSGEHVGIVDIAGTTDSIHKLAKVHEQARLAGHQGDWTHLSFSSTRDDLSDSLAALATYPEVFASIEWLSIKQAGDLQMHELFEVFPNLLFLQFGGKANVTGPCRHARLKTLVCHPTMAMDNFLSLCSFPSLEAFKVTSLTDAVVEGLLNMNLKLRYLGVTGSGVVEKLMPRVDRLMTELPITELSFTGLWNNNVIVNACSLCPWWSRITALWIPDSSMQWRQLADCREALMPNLSYLRFTANDRSLNAWAKALDDDLERVRLRHGVYVDIRGAILDDDALMALRKIVVLNQCGGLTMDPLENSQERRLMQRLPMSGKR